MSYSPTLGRWIQADPKVYVDGMNFYEGLASNPVRYTDPFGLEVEYEGVNSEFAKEQYPRPDVELMSPEFLTVFADPNTHSYGGTGPGTGAGIPLKPTAPPKVEGDGPFTATGEYEPDAILASTTNFLYMSPETAAALAAAGVDVSKLQAKLYLLNTLLHIHEYIRAYMWMMSYSDSYNLSATGESPEEAMKRLTAEQERLRKELHDRQNDLYESTIAPYLRALERLLIDNINADRNKGNAKPEC